MRSKRAVLATVGTVALVAAAATAAAIQDVKEYAVGIAGGYETKALLSTGDTVPETSDPSREYQMVGIPDGLGAYRARHGTTAVHEPRARQATRRSRSSARPLNRGAIVSKFVARPRRRRDLRPTARTTGSSRRTSSSARRRRLGNTTRAFGRFCSGSIAGRRRASTGGSISRGRNHRRRHFRRQGRPGSRHVRQRDPRAPVARALRLGEHARPAEARRPHTVMS